MNFPENVRLMIAVPTMGNLKTELVARLLKWQSQIPNNQLAVYFTQNIAPTDRARNHIAKVFLEQKLNGQPLTHLLMIDSDTVPQADAPFCLLEHDLPFVSGMTPIASRDKQTGDRQFYDNCFAYTKEEEGEIRTHIAQRGTGLQPIKRCGAACLMVKREVFEKLDPPFFKFVTSEDGLEHTRSEDIYFCDQVTDAGFQLHADTDVICTHHKVLDF